ncbi:uncharacterized protein LOC128883532 [Hylaeus volcanicus]|uniref:uncharacterized protein LOC128883532 n=1 Tax=Hylaeus volcanicus TaxID=313075 RepID=UPI0023B7752E|nr:uncharacterized protein LOC128883532 [Hylaeus volcanicus]
MKLFLVFISVIFVQYDFSSIVALPLPFGPGRTGIYERTEECVGAQSFENEFLSVLLSKIDKRMLLSINFKNISTVSPSLISSECMKPNAKWLFHIHEKSTTAGKIGIGASACSSAVVGLHWDPTLACSINSGNELCKRLPIPPSSSIPVKYQASLRKYSCTPETYTNQSVYACELGDLSGKYFPLVIPPPELNSISMAVDIFDPRDVLPTCELDSKSLVLHCNNAPVLCIPIVGMRQPISYFYSALRSEGPTIRRYHNFLTSYFSSSI